MRAKNGSGSANTNDELSLPKHWKTNIKSAILRVISLAQLSLAVARGRMTTSGAMSDRLAIDASHISVLERFIKTLKNECTRNMLLPLDRRRLPREMSFFLDWYNVHRPHTTLAGKTPDEVYYKTPPRNRKPRMEPRAQWPRPSPCAGPRVLVAGQPGDRFQMQVTFLAGHRQLPIVSLKRAA